VVQETVHDKDGLVSFEQTYGDAKLFKTNAKYDKASQNVAVNIAAGEETFKGNFHLLNAKSGIVSFSGDYGGGHGNLKVDITIKSNVVTGTFMLEGSKTEKTLDLGKKPVEIDLTPTVITKATKGKTLGSATQLALLNMFGQFLLNKSKNPLTEHDKHSV